VFAWAVTLGLRGAELEMRAAEEPLKSNLDVAGLKAQEREREEILSELVPAMEARGYDMGAVREVMGGYKLVYFSGREFLNDVTGRRIGFYALQRRRTTSPK
jgi:hypothetical protein